MPNPGQSETQMRNDTHILLAELSNAPVMIAADAETRVLAYFQGIAESPDFAAITMSKMASLSSEDFWNPEGWEARYRPYKVVNGILQIAVAGVLLHRFPYQIGRYATGYPYVEQAISRGVADSSVRGIALICDSPGGEVSGCFELSDFIREQSALKPIRAYASDHAFSAAYALASAAETITITRSGQVGSVGVLTSHVDYSGMLDQMGLKITLIFAGKHKVDANPYEKLPDSVKARIQERINRIYGTFVSLVARNRDMEEGAVRATEALTYDAEEAIGIGFADRIGELEEAMATFESEAAEMENVQMTQTPQNTPVAGTENTITAEALQAAVSTARTDAATAERSRIQAVLESEPAKNRRASATKLVFNPKLANLSAEDLTEMLADLPEEKAEGSGAAPEGQAPTGGQSPFDAAMNGTPNPGITAEGEGEGKPRDVASAILTDFSRATGRTRRA